PEPHVGGPGAGRGRRARRLTAKHTPGGGRGPRALRGGPLPQAVQEPGLPGQAPAHEARGALRGGRAGPARALPQGAVPGRPAQAAAAHPGGGDERVQHGGRRGGAEGAVPEPAA
ncbi:unnamed protein product, partial [Heterosigma akashiwo]